MNNNFESLIEQLRSGDARALARTISTVENRAPGWLDLLRALFPHSGHARIIGLTGPPGAGKSTLVDQLTRHYREQNHSIGIIAVDPTSPYTGGAVLGDRIRMQEHFSDPGIYIRSMATRGSLGGLARTTADVATVLDAAGRDLIMIETVGVGQDEVDIVRLADITVVILVPGMGDDVQTIKAGIMEIADVFVINKSDRDGAERVEREIRALQSLAVRSDHWIPPIVKTVASARVGIKELAAAISAYETHLQKESLILQKKIQNWQDRLLEMLREALLEGARKLLENGAAAGYAAEIAEHKRDPYELVEEIVGKMEPCFRGGTGIGAPPSGSASGTPAPTLNARRGDSAMPRIDHIGVAVKSLAAAKAIYEKLELSISPEEVIEAEQVRVVMVPLGESRLELLEPTSEDSVIAKFIALRGEGLHHVSLCVPNLEAAVERLKKERVRLVSDDIKVGAGGHRYVFVHPSSAGGVLLELVEAN